MSNNALSLFTASDAAEYVNVTFLSDASSLYVLKNKLQRYYLTSNFIKYYDYNLWEIVLITKAIQ